MAAPFVLAALGGCLAAPHPLPPLEPDEPEPIPTVLVVGDSLADQIARGLERVADGELEIVNGGVNGCGIGPGEVEAFGDDIWHASACADWPDNWQAWVESLDPALVVLHTGWWESFDRRVEGQVHDFGSPENDAQLQAAYERAMQILGSQATPVAWLTAPCFQPAPWQGNTFDYADWKIDHINALYQSFVPAQAGATLIDYRPSICPGGQYAAVVDGVSVRSDDGIHFTPAGADVVARWLRLQLPALGT